MLLIDELINQHNIIKETLAEIKTMYNDKANSEKISDKLTLTKTLFIQHLDLEDHQLFPIILKKLTSINSNIQSKKIRVKKFWSEMKKITPIVLDYLDFYCDSKNIEAKISNYKIKTD